MFKRMSPLALVLTIFFLPCCTKDAKTPPPPESQAIPNKEAAPSTTVQTFADAKDTKDDFANNREGVTKDEFEAVEEFRKAVGDRQDSSGGPAPAGSGAGWGGGSRTGIGVDNGPSRGGVGVRNGGGRKLMVKRHGSKAPPSSPEMALSWLAAHQEADGHFDTQKFGAAEKSDVASTSLALLAILGAGHTEKVGQYKDNVQRAVAWLKSKQAADGAISDPADTQKLLPYQALATLSLCEAAGMANVPETKATARKAVEYCVGKQIGNSGWASGKDAEPDLKTTVWYVFALKSAKVAGLTVDAKAFESASKFLDSVEHRVDKYNRASAATYWLTAKTEQADEVSLLTAMGVVCRQFMGGRREDLTASVEAFIKTGGVPEASANGEIQNLLYFYIAELCAFQHGGDIWYSLHEPLKKTLVENQCKTGDETGSWRSAGDLGKVCGRVCQTALGALCLEIYYCYENSKLIILNEPTSKAAPHQ